MRYLILSLILSVGSGCLFGCGSKLDQLREHRLEITGFEAEFFSFQSLYGQDIDDLTIEFGLPGPPPTIGLCMWSAGTTPAIIIDKNFWDGHDGYMKEALIFHEMGHCVKQLDHNDTGLHIMNSIIPPHDRYVKNRQLLILELFSLPNGRLSAP